MNWKINRKINMGFLDRFRKKAHEFNFSVLNIDGGSHGEHWLSIHSDPNWFVQNLDEIIEGANPPIEVETPIEHALLQKVLGLVTPHNEHLQLLNQLAISEENETRLTTGYPMLKRGVAIDLVIKTMRIWKVKTEAYANCLIGDHTLTFFPVDLFAHRDDYLNEKVTRVELSGLAYKVDVDPAAAANTDFSQIKGAVSIDDKSFYVKLNSSHEDDYYVYGELVNMERSDSAGEEAYLLTVACGPLGNLPVFCLRSKMDKEPFVGQSIGANLWMTGKWAEGIL